MHSLKVESFVLFGGLAEEFKPRRQLSDSSKGLLWRGKQGARITGVLQPKNNNEKQVGRIPKDYCYLKNQTFQFSEFSTFLCICCCRLVTKSYPTLLWPHRLWTTRPFCPWGFSRQEDWTGLVFPSPGDLVHPRIKLHILPWQADSLSLRHQGSTFYVYKDAKGWAHGNHSFHVQPQSSGASLLCFPALNFLRVPCWGMAAVVDGLMVGIPFPSSSSFWAHLQGWL